MVATTTGDLKGYTNREFVATTESWEGLAMVVNPLASDYMNMVRSGLIHNFPVAPEAATITTTILGPDVAYLEVKTTRKSYKPVVMEYVKIPQHILDFSKTENLAADVMLVNGLRLLFRTSRRIKFTTL